MSPGITPFTILFRKEPGRERSYLIRYSRLAAKT